jgi:hypothetical protein
MVDLSFLAVWSAMTAVAGSLGILQLALARVGVGVGEAGCTHTAHSLIADAAALFAIAFSIPVARIGLNNRRSKRSIRLAHCLDAGWHTRFITGFDITLDTARSPDGALTVHISVQPRQQQTRIVD